MLQSYFQVSSEMLDRVQVWALARPLKNIQRLVPKPLLHCLGCVLRVVVLLEGESSPQSEVLSALEQVFIEGSPISTEELWSSVCDHWVLGHLHDHGPSPPIAQFGLAASSRKSLGGSILPPFKNDGGHCILEDVQCCRNVLAPFPRSVLQHNPVSELYGQFLWPHILFFFL